MTSLSFRSSKVIYYGPHACENCGVSICRAGFDFGGSSFTYPEGPIYPNTEWNPHFCNPQDVRDQRGKEAMAEVRKRYPEAVPLKWHGGFVISQDGSQSTIISPRLTMHEDVLSAWSGAKEREERGLPKWDIEAEKHH
jgi:hypothetical protein